MQKTRCALAVGLAMITGVAMTLGIPEAAVSCVVVGAVCKALEMVMRRQAT